MALLRYHYEICSNVPINMIKCSWYFQLYLIIGLIWYTRHYCGNTFEDSEDLIVLIFIQGPAHTQPPPFLYKYGIITFLDMTYDICVLHKSNNSIFSFSLFSFWSTKNSSMFLLMVWVLKNRWNNFLKCYFIYDFPVFKQV